jgi:hypothetical protein
MNLVARQSNYDVITEQIRPVRRRHPSYGIRDLF